MIPKASRKERTNMTAAGATSESIVVYTISSNRTFILTDLYFSYNDSGVGITLFDSIVATASPTAAQTKWQFRGGNPVQITQLENGPEFSLGVSCRMDDSNHALPTYGIFVGGYER